MQIEINNFILLLNIFFLLITLFFFSLLKADIKVSYEKERESSIAGQRGGGSENTCNDVNIEKFFKRLNF